MGDLIREDGGAGGGPVSNQSASGFTGFILA